MACAIRSEKICIRSNSLGHPFKKIVRPFERLESSVQKIIVFHSNGYSIKFIEHGLPFELNGLGYEPKMMVKSEIFLPRAEVFLSLNYLAVIRRLCVNNGRNDVELRYFKQNANRRASYSEDNDRDYRLAFEIVFTF